MDNLQSYWDLIVKMSAVYAPKFLLAVITLIVGLWIIKRVVKLIRKIMAKSSVDPSLQSFLVPLISILFKILLILSVVSMVGIETTSFIALLASAGFAIGMALQGSLGNFAGGVLILLFKPYKIDDYIEAQGFQGAVKEIHIFNTVLLTVDNKRIFIPNGAISNGAITNYTAEDKRRLDLSFGIGYGDDIDKAKGIIEKIIKEDDRVLSEPAYLVAVGQLGDNSVNFTVRIWCKTGDYWNINFDIHEKVKKEFDANGISIPFPQRDIHVYNH
ncbi:MAG: mechanosensitive ion channel domain-containing protein [bacterium]